MSTTPWHDGIVIGIDPSLTGTGLCWSDYDTKTLAFRNRKADPKQDHRLVRIAAAIATLLSSSTVDLVVVEDVPPYSTQSASLGLVQGVIRHLCAQYMVPVMLVSPTALKAFATGKGRASKEQMADHPRINPRWDDNAVDAWWLRQVGLVWLGRDNLASPGAVAKPNRVIANDQRDIGDLA